LVQYFILKFIISKEKFLVKRCGVVTASIQTGDGIAFEYEFSLLFS